MWLITTLQPVGVAKESSTAKYKKNSYKEEKLAIEQQ